MNALYTLFLYTHNVLFEKCENVKNFQIFYVIIKWNNYLLILSFLDNSIEIVLFIGELGRTFVW